MSICNAGSSLQRSFQRQMGAKPRYPRPKIMVPVLSNSRRNIGLDHENVIVRRNLSMLDVKALLYIRRNGRRRLPGDMMNMVRRAS